MSMRDTGMFLSLFFFLLREVRMRRECSSSCHLPERQRRKQNFPPFFPLSPQHTVSFPLLDEHWRKKEVEEKAHVLLLLPAVALFLFCDYPLRRLNAG